MPRLLRLLLTTLLLATTTMGGITSAVAEQKAPNLSVKDKQGICDFRWITCLDGCDHASDPDVSLATCQRWCDRLHNSCLKRAQTLEAPEVGTDNGMSKPNLTVAP
jgi:hypothetical protein